MLKVSAVQYLNTVPLVWGMLRGPQQGLFDLSFTTPARCADAVRSGQADVGIVPSIEYQRMNGLEIVPGLSISSRNQVRSVILLSNIPIEKLKSVVVDNSSRTSVALLQVLLRKFYDRQVAFTFASPEPRPMLAQADAALLIGDTAMTHNLAVPFVYDLAAEWRKFTSLPFVFALWAGKRNAQLGQSRQAFLASRDYGLAHVDDIAAEYAPKLNLPQTELKVYLTENIDYSLDEENLRGLRHFYELAHTTGIISRVKELRFAGD